MPVSLAGLIFSFAIFAAHQLYTDLRDTISALEQRIYRVQLQAERSAEALRHCNCGGR